MLVWCSVFAVWLLPSIVDDLFLTTAGNYVTMSTMIIEQKNFTLWNLVSMRALWLGSLIHSGFTIHRLYVKNVRENLHSDCRAKLLPFEKFYCRKECKILLLQSACVCQSTKIISLVSQISFSFYQILVLVGFAVSRWHVWPCEILSKVRVRKIFVIWPVLKESWQIDWTWSSSSRMQTLCVLWQKRDPEFVMWKYRKKHLRQCTRSTAGNRLVWFCIESMYCPLWISRWCRKPDLWCKSNSLEHWKCLASQWSFCKCITVHKV